MKKTNFILPILALFLFAGIFSSCSKYPDNLQIVPKDATAVMVIDMQNLYLKGNLDKITELKMYKAFQKEVKNENKKVSKILEKIFKDPKETGIDFSKELIGFYSNQTSEERYFAITASISSAENFEQILDDLINDLELDIDIEKEDEYKYMLSENSEYSQNPIIAWNDDKLLILYPAYYADKAEEKDENLLAYAEDLMSLKEADAITELKDFQEFYAENEDFNIWLSSNMLSDILSDRESKLLNSKLDFDLDDNFIHTHLGFSDGEIAMNVKLSYNDEMKAYLMTDKIWKDNLDSDLLSLLPEEKYIVASFAFNPEQYLEVLEKSDDWAMLADMFEKNAGFSLKDAFSSFSGDMLYSISDVKTKTIEYNSQTYGEKDGTFQYYDTVKVREQIMPIMTFCAKMNDDKIFKETMELIPEKKLQKKSKYYELDLGGITVYIGNANNILTITNGEKIIKKSLDGGFGSNSLKNSDISSDITDSYYYTYVNLNYEEYSKDLQAEIEKNMNDSEYKIFQELSSIYSSISVEATSANSYKMTLKLKTDDENSLSTIIENVDSNFKKMLAL